MSFSHGGPDDDMRLRDKRSIFVANVGFDTTEEQLGKVLCEVGPIVNLKLIYDSATGKPRGFGFCEYEDTETAMSAVRNLAGRELSGRPLRIDSACNAPSAGGPGSGGVGVNAGGFRGAGPGPLLKPVEPPVHGAAVPPENAPEHITKAVASLPPEQMYELMTQMKWFIQQNPQEARQLLLHNPQLAYALLQAQVVMKIVDLETAQSLLHRTSRGPSLIPPTSGGKKDALPPGPPAPVDHHGPPGGPGEQPPPAWDQFRGGAPQGGRDDRGRPGQPGPPPPSGDYSRMRPGGPPGFDRVPPPGHRGSPHREMRPSESVPPPPPPPPRDQQGPPGQAQDQEKAALIMQVLSLTDEQIQMLPSDQRTSILKLKDQIARSR